jgi:hypothetical protein
MGFLNLSSSIRYSPHGKKRKTKAFKNTKYKRLIAEQQIQYDLVIQSIKEEERIPSYIGTSTGDITPKREPMQYTGERKLLGIATMHKSNMVPIFEEDKQHAIDIARMRRN